MFHDKEYWENYYNRKTKIDIGFDNPSSFAIFINKQLSNNESKLIELGCGNGRDSIFFSENGKKVLAIDQCKNTTNILNKINTNLTALDADFTRLTSDLDFEPDIIYSRFTLHSINEDGEDRTIKWVAETLKSNGLFCIEARTILDPLCGKGKSEGRNVWYTDHYRRFVVAKEIKDKLTSKGFIIEYFIEDNNLSIYKDDNPVVLRIIARKQ